jgi:hypothetical protein
VARVLAIVLAALGLAYACLWWSYQQFYEQFGVSPQDVGLTPTGSASDIAGAALQLGIWLLIVVAVLTFLPVAAVTVVTAAWEGTVREIRIAAAAVAAVASLLGLTAFLYWRLVHHWAGELISLTIAAAVFALLRILVPLIGKTAAAAVAVLVGLTAFLYWWLVDNWVGLILLTIAAAVFALLRVLLPLLGDVYAAEPGEPASVEAKVVAAGIGWATPRLALIVALATAVVGMTFLDLPTDAAEAGKCARRYIPHQSAESVPVLNLPIPGLHLPILSVHAQPANLKWLPGSKPARITDTNVIYLGEAGGSVVVYNRQAQTTRRLPAASVVMSVNTKAPKCGGVH